MTELPEDMYKRVFDLATGLVTASESGDVENMWRLYNELREYCEAESASGRDHPFLWETLADFTTDEKAATDLYLKALESARKLKAPEFEASVLLALAERSRAIGDGESANQYALQAGEVAKVLDDSELKEAIAEFFLEAPSRE